MIGMNQKVIELISSDRGSLVLKQALEIAIKALASNEIESLNQPSNAEDMKKILKALNYSNYVINEVEYVPNKPCFYHKPCRNIPAVGDYGKGELLIMTPGENSFLVNGLKCATCGKKIVFCEQEN